MSKIPHAQDSGLAWLTVILPVFSVGCGVSGWSRACPKLRHEWCEQTLSAEWSWTCYCTGSVAECLSCATRSYSANITTKMRQQEKSTSARIRLSDDVLSLVVSVLPNYCEDILSQATFLRLGWISRFNHVQNIHSNTMSFYKWNLHWNCMDLHM